MAGEGWDMKSPILWATDVVVGGSLTIFAAISIFSGGSVQGVTIDFSMFILGMLLLFNAKEMAT